MGTNEPPKPAAPPLEIPLPPPSWRRFWPRLTLAGLLIALVLGFYLFGLDQYVSWDYLRSNLEFYQLQVRDHLWLAIIVFFAIYLVTTALSVPVAGPLSILAGALFDLWAGTTVVAASASLGATLAFWSSRYLFHDFVQRQFGGRLHAINAGIERDGPYYLFTLRLVPLLPFFAVNLCMGLTRIRAWTYFWVTLLGMLPASFFYVNAGRELARIDSPSDALSPTLIVSLVLIGVMPLLFRKLMQWKVRLRTIANAMALLLLLSVLVLVVGTQIHYWTSERMNIAIKELTNAEYPEDPAHRSVHFGQFDGRRLVLLQKDETHFDFILEPSNDHTARIVMHDVDVSVLTPSLPEWTKADDGLRRIALTERQWNRQQISFGRDAPQVEITWGNGFEKSNLFSAELAANGLSAGLWEVLLFTKEDGRKALYYHGWFTFPLGHYAHLFERNTGLTYWKHFYYLEQWDDPVGTPLPLDGLRQVKAEREVPATFLGDEEVIADDEQAQKRRAVIAENVVRWKDYYDGRKVRFAAFVPPGRYSFHRPWKNEYWRLREFQKAIWREVVSPAADKPLRELELVFTGKGGGLCRFLVSGFDPSALPPLSVADYAQGLCVPMGIGTPPFFQSYDAVQKNLADFKRYFSVALDADGHWLNHHELAVDGSYLHRDADDPSVLHVYLLSYERQALIAHFRVETGN